MPLPDITNIINNEIHQLLQSKIDSLSVYEQSLTDQLTHIQSLTTIHEHVHFQQWIQVAKTHTIWIGSIIAILFIIHIINIVSTYKLNDIGGLKPRTVKGLKGIIFVVFLHGDWGHLISNSLSLFLLLHLLFIYPVPLVVIATIFIVVIGGLLSWLMARNGNHIGASGLIFGYMSFILIYGWKHPSAKAIIIICVFLAIFGLRFLSGLIPSTRNNSQNISWEGHLFGFIAGICTVYLLSYFQINY